MTSPNLIKDGTLTIGLDIRISSCSLDSQHGGGGIRHPSNVGRSNFRYTNYDKSNCSTQKDQRKNEPGKKTNIFSLLS